MKRRATENTAVSFFLKVIDTQELARQIFEGALAHPASKDNSKWTPGKHFGACGQSCPCCREALKECFGGCEFCANTAALGFASLACKKAVDESYLARFDSGGNAQGGRFSSDASGHASEHTKAGTEDEHRFDLNTMMTPSCAVTASSPLRPSARPETVCTLYTLPGKSCEDGVIGPISMSKRADDGVQWLTVYVMVSRGVGSTRFRSTGLTSMLRDVTYGEPPGTFAAQSSTDQNVSRQQYEEDQSRGTVGLHTVWWRSTQMEKHV